ncbi:MAG TPA: DUF1800 domain-containing protein [Ramlibacter sp.]|jgi:uncharacterized protein (DUF1800 family)|uniref:DUF1800 domain-containing protein n=1 Tax=Ramlibacter sp. TaxID=1917967 RepID=UPI002D4CD00B|nr:DUF1800 domain-containing protein [Ramlibacter sp.]HZY19095.1 DUF1800 domain-containing protein [Ramlibacter sp.]
MEEDIQVGDDLRDDTGVAGSGMQWLAAAAVAAPLLAACGGGGGDVSGARWAGSVSGPDTPEQAARFMAQATLGARRQDLDTLQAMGYAAWLEDQFNQPRSQSHFDWLLANGYGNESFRNSTAGLDNSIWRKFITSPDALRQRMTLALSEILVVSVLGVDATFRQFAVANYLDILEANAFGNYRQLLQQVTLSTAMGYYLTYRGNARASAQGSQPDENYARELMQLFTIGLVQLDPEGRVRPGSPETYGQADVSGLARVFTGWNLDTTGLAQPLPPEVHRRPMVQSGNRYETGSKSFLGVTLPAGTPAAAALSTALDTLFNHPNLPPFVGRQLIQRLVTSNPSPAYVGRVAATFADNGRGVRGDLQAVLRAILLDPEARDAATAAAPTFGKLREPVVRFLQWARTFGASSASGVWAIGDLSDAGNRLGQSPMRSPSVFNFFRPGYVPPNSAVAQAGLEGPEFQITNESSVAGYLNFMQNAIAGSSVGDVRADYGALLALAPDSRALLDEINLLLAARQLSAPTLAALKTALDTVPVATDAGRRNRVQAALLLVLACPEYLVQK